MCNYGLDFSGWFGHRRAGNKPAASVPG